MITDNDIKKFEKIFVTKKELKLEIDRANNYTEKLFMFLSKDLLEFKKEMREFREEMREFREQTYKTLDWLVGAFKKFDEEHTILTTRYSTISKTIDNHEDRIVALEKN